MQRVPVCVLVLLPSLLLSRAALAQETPTERQAARGVLQKLDALERSLDVPALVTRLTGANAERDGIRQLFGEDLAALEKTYTEPVVREPK